MTSPITLHGADTMRASLGKQILAVAAPHMHDSGYRKALDPSKGILGPTRALRLWAPKDSPAELDGFCVTNLYAVTEDGVISDATGGGAFVEGFETLPIEDLVMILDLVTRAIHGEDEPKEAAPAGAATFQGHILFATSTQGDVSVIESSFAAEGPSLLELLARAGDLAEKRKINPGQIWRWDGTFSRFKNGNPRWSGELRPMRVKFRFEKRAA